MECAADFDDVNFYFGGDDFTLTVRETSAATVFVCIVSAGGVCSPCTAPCCQAVLLLS